MRGRRAIVAGIGLVLLTGGCDALDRRYTRHGVGIDLHTSEMADGMRLQEFYAGYVCRQAGLPFSDAGGTLVCGLPPVSRSWAAFVQAGMDDIDRRCDAYLAWLDNRRRGTGPIHQHAIAVVAAAFGLALHSFTKFNSRLLFEVERSTVQSAVLTMQRSYRQDLPAIIDNKPAAIHALRRYLRLCMPMTIATQINTTKRFERDGLTGLAAAKASPKTVRTSTIKKARVAASTPGVATRIRAFSAASAGNRALIRDWMRTNGFAVPFAVFIRSADNAADRRRMAAELNIR